jgi:hypothetical protein
MLMGNKDQYSRQGTAMFVHDHVHYCSMDDYGRLQDHPLHTLWPPAVFQKHSPIQLRVARSCEALFELQSGQ